MRTTGRWIAAGVFALLANCSAGPRGGGDAAPDAGADGTTPGGDSGDAGSVLDARPDGDSGGRTDGGARDVTGSQGDASATCGDAGCARGQRCAHATCVPDLGNCSTNDDCPGDSYCDTDMTCVPYGVPPDHTNDPSCQRSQTLPMILPEVQCEWTGPGASDPTASYVNVYTAPYVADLNLDHDARNLQPSIVLTTFADLGSLRRGMVRVFDGRTCTEQMNIGIPDTADGDANEPGYGSQYAIGDLDGDLVRTGDTVAGHPEIVTFHRTPGTSNDQPLELIAYHIVDAPSAHLERLWIGRRCNTGGSDVPFQFGSNVRNNGPSLADLDDDGRPEVLVDRYVFDANGCVLNPGETFSDYIQLGVFAVVADVDLDGKPELVRADGVFAWDTSAHDWTLEPYWQPAGPLAEGNVAVADFGTYPTITTAPAGARIPEVVVVSAQDPTTFDPSSSGTVRIQSITGQIVFGPVGIYTDPGQPAGHGGAPTAADFDGDGLPEFAAAANRYYTVYDPDCVGAGDPSHRAGGRCMRTAGTSFPDGVLWGRASQDFSSSVTGSSVFDFNADGAAEVVYRDECYLRVYRGADGAVLYSTPASSGTGYELPVIADVDGDFATEIAVSRADNGGNCPATDPLVPGSTQTWSRSTGFAILRDPQDRWANSRPVWNQHAYSVTNVTDDAHIPRTRDAVPNWTVTGLNNFRQNVQGDLARANIADLTVSLASSDLCSTAGGSLTLTARVCNRGTNPVGDGAAVVFTEPSGDGGRSVLCAAATQHLLAPGECDDVSCTANVDAASARQILVTVDPQGTIADCHPGNNQGVVPQVYCPPG